MQQNAMKKHISIFVIGFLMLEEASSWAASKPINLSRNLRSELILFSSKDEVVDSDAADSRGKLFDSAEDTEVKASTYGVSYIGGDPCGSKYNDDPFDASREVSKPGMPDDMKDRIAAMAAEMLKKQQQNQGDSS